jgi:hypothetical protein
MALSERDRRTVTIGAVVVGVALAGFLLFSVLGGGEEALPPTGPPLTPPAGSPSPVPGGNGGPPIQSFSGRDPFSVPPALSPSPAPSAPGGGGSPSPSNGGGGNNGGGTQTPSPTAPGGGSSQNVGGSTVVLLDVFERDGATRVQVEVDGTVYDVAIGQQFAGGRFELSSVSGNCATFLFGDERFTLCINAQK